MIYVIITISINEQKVIEMASANIVKHWSLQLTTEEQNARYLARTPAERETRRLARRKVKKASRHQRTDIHFERNQARRERIQANRHANIINSVSGKVAVEQFVCIDLEQFERNQRKLTEVGISVVCSQTNQIKTTHLIIKEHYNLRNKKFVCDNKDNFLFGNSVTVSLEEAKRQISNVLSEHEYLVGHGIGNDMKFIQKELGIKSKVATLNTDNLFKAVVNKNTQTSLSNVCKHFDIKHDAPHNAGNDSHVNMNMFLQLRRDILEIKSGAMAA